MVLVTKIIKYLLTSSLFWTILGGVKGGKLIKYDEETVLEDVIGTYELESIKSLISNSTSKVSVAIKQLRKDSFESLEKYQNEMKAQNNFLQTSINTLSETMKGTKDYINQVYSGIKDTLTSFMTKSNQNLSNLKLFIEQESRMFRNVLGQAKFASQQILANDCLDLYNLHYNASGTYWLPKFGLQVLCDMESDGKGWLVIQRRAKVSKQVRYSCYVFYLY